MNLVSRTLGAAVLLAQAFAVTLVADVRRDIVATDASFSPDTTLPGVPVWVAFTVTNRTDHPLPFPVRYVVEVTPEGGATFELVHVEWTMVAVPDVYRHDLAARESRRVEFATGRDLTDDWMSDRRWWAAGTYRVRVLLRPLLSYTQRAPTPDSSPVVTPEFTLTVEEPAGEDAQVYALLHERRSFLPFASNVRGPEVGHELWERFRGSRYAPFIGKGALRYAAEMGGERRVESMREIYEEIVALDRVGIFADAIKLGWAQSKTALAHQQPSLEAATRMNAEGRAELQRIADTAPHEFTRVTARAMLRKVRTEQELSDFFAPNRDDQ